ncbi:MAG: sulfite exporter TauE/SafE family protein [Bryobacteraceae bacterium]
MTISQGLLLAGAAATAGAMNSVAGGGTFIAFPALLLTGVLPVPANATATFALTPGAAASAIAYRHDMTASKKLLIPMTIVSLVGGGIGAWLLLHTSNESFTKLIPFLLLFASLLFTFSGKLSAHMRKWNKTESPTSATIAVTGFIQLLIAIYGGYFGAGIGILMIAAWSALGIGNIHSVNSMRSLLGTVINATAMVMFIATKSIVFGPGLLMMATAIAAGYSGAAYARRLPPLLVRRFVLAIAWFMTVYFFWKFYR